MPTQPHQSQPALFNANQHQPTMMGHLLSNHSSLHALRNRFFRGVCFWLVDNKRKESSAATQQKPSVLPAVRLPSFTSHGGECDQTQHTTCSPAPQNYASKR